MQLNLNYFIKNLAEIDISDCVSMLMSLDLDHAKRNPEIFCEPERKESYPKYFMDFIGKELTYAKGIYIDNCLAGYLLANVRIKNKIDTFAARKYVYIHSMFIEKKYRRCGYASALIRDLKLWMTENHIGNLKLQLTVWDTNIEAVNLYQKLGFNALKTEMIC